MKKYFPGFYNPSEEEFQILWNTCTFVFDTNILLHSYRFEESAREVLLTIFKTIKDRIWIPYQVALEYHHLINKEKLDQEHAYDQLSKELSKIQNSVEDKFKNYSLQHTNLKLNESLHTSFVNSLEALITDLKEQKNSHPDLENIKYKLAEIFEDKVGEPYTQEQLTEIYGEGEERFSKKIPPGFKDAKNKEGKTKYFNGIHYEDKFGDYVLWKQIMDYSKANKRDIIFVTDDQKEDWWNISKGKTLGIHPELVQEFTGNTNQSFYMYNTKRFLKNILNFIPVQVTEAKIMEAIESINNYKRAVEESQTADHNLYSVSSVNFNPSNPNAFMDESSLSSLNVVRKNENMNFTINSYTFGFNKGLEKGIEKIIIDKIGSIFNKHYKDHYYEITYREDEENRTWFECFVQTNANLDSDLFFYIFRIFQDDYDFKLVSILRT
ncbi:MULTISPECIES: PIN-like domain-containing protein [Bacillus subtilis group]|uniref:PIN-like domain-containing protein n=1 Tax=Bacillus subtilis group TaxID=653685 RepID=UPI000D0449C6|nr:MULTISPECIES: PIN-like domain-containing protein [Bacillus mojavensis subgroup]MEC1755680.1 PIN domain-containing protein [Bacillus mojavensis]PRS23362.1 hypothetical protein C6W25_06780 [Bacillus halotolerans]